MNNESYKQSLFPGSEEPGFFNPRFIIKRINNFIKINRYKYSSQSEIHSLYKRFLEETGAFAYNDNRMKTIHWRNIKDAE